MSVTRVRSSYVNIVVKDVLQETLHNVNLEDKNAFESHTKKLVAVCVFYRPEQVSSLKRSLFLAAWRVLTCVVILAR